MKKVTKLAAGIALVTCTMSAGSAFADVSYNVGWASEYYFRGALQKSSSASAGIDFEESGFYIGSWAADVGDGLEVDGYFGYGIETEAGFSASLGFTGYYYTGEFDDTYEEINLSLGYGMFTLDYAVGEYDNFGTPLDYDILNLTVASDTGFYGTYGTWGDDFDGDYFEVGYGFSAMELDFGIAAVFSSDEFAGLNGEFDSAGNPDESEAIIFTIGKSW